MLKKIQANPQGKDVIKQQWLNIAKDFEIVNLEQMQLEVKKSQNSDMIDTRFSDLEKKIKNLLNEAEKFIIQANQIQQLG